MGDVFAAVGDPTRRQLVDWLSAEGGGTATVFASRLPITRQAVARHLHEMESAGLVSSQRVGRETRYSLRPEALGEMARWLESRARAWDHALQRLSQHLED